MPRHLEVGQAFPGERHDLLRRDLAHDVGLPDLAHALIWYADHGDVGDPVQPGEGLLDLGGIDVEAAGDVHVLEPVGDGQVAFGVERADVAGVQPAVGVDRLRGGFIVVEVAEHHVVATKQELPGFAVGRVDPGLHPGHGPTA